MRTRRSPQRKAFNCSARRPRRQALDLFLRGIFGAAMAWCYRSFSLHVFKIRNPKSEGRKKAEVRNPKSSGQTRSKFGARIADFFRPTDCGFRISHILATTLLLFSLSGCGKPHGTVLGKAPKGEVRTILSVRAGDSPPQVVIAGVMVEKCPVAGCWLRVQDRTGVIKIDTKSAGFAVVNVPLETKVTVAGKVVPDGNDMALEATGLRY
jgi:uncharacterized protein YdeI (BOF family)